jgi:hypothetical protein
VQSIAPEKEHTMKTRNYYRRRNRRSFEDSAREAALAIAVTCLSLLPLLCAAAAAALTIQ